MHYIELNVVGGTSVCLPLGSFMFWVGSEGGSIIRLLGADTTPMLVDESYEYIVDVLATCGDVRVHRAPEEDAA
jgi:hypothetical protein